MRIASIFLLLFKRLLLFPSAVGGLDLVADQHDEVDQGPDAEAAAGDQLHDAQTGVAQVETVDAEAAEEEGKKQSSSLILHSNCHPFCWGKYKMLSE